MCINDLIAILFDIILQNNIFSIVALMIVLVVILLSVKD